MVGRTIHPATDIALDEPNIPLLVFVELAFADATLRLHSAERGRTINWNGFDWLGTGELGEITGIDESDELKSADVQFALSGIDPTLLNEALSENYHGRPANVWLAILDDQYEIEGQPIGPFGYKMDNLEGEVGKEGRLILTAKNHLADWERARIRRYTNEDQQAEYPGDLGMEFVSQMVEKELVW